MAEIRSGGHRFLEKHGGGGRVAFFKMIDIEGKVLIFEECRRVDILTAGA